MPISRPHRSLALTPLAFLPLFAATAAPRAGAAEVEPGFNLSVEASRLPNGTAMQFAPDGRLFVCQQNGLLRVVRNGRLQEKPFLRLNVDSRGERGFLGLAFDPGFERNGWFYVYYTAPDPIRRNRVCRFTARGDRAIPSSEVLLLDLDRLPFSTNHNGGALHVGPDGMLYIATGDLANGGNAPSLRSLSGKILRIRLDGSIPASNPYFPATLGAYRSIWARGLRNPFTFAFEPGSGRMFINDVGQNTWEEINLGQAGADYGWPATEGPTSIGGYRGPFFAYEHSGGDLTGGAITGGAFYRPDRQLFPGEYLGRYFFGDFVGGWVRALNPANKTHAPVATDIPGLVDLKVGPDGALYCLSRGDAAVYRIGWGNEPPPALKAFKIRPRRVRRGRSAQGRLFFTAPLRSPVRVTLSSPDAGRLRLPTQVVVPAGTDRGTFRIRARKRAATGRAAASATAGAVTKEAILTIRR